MRISGPGAAAPSPAILTRDGRRPPGAENIYRYRVTARGDRTHRITVTLDDRRDALSNAARPFKTRMNAPAGPAGVSARPRIGA